jgi:uncharacterized protein (DUF924 family)
MKRGFLDTQLKNTMSDAPTDSPQQVLGFWFALERPGQKDDAAVRAVLGPLYERAAAHRLDGWAEVPRSRLALILLLDQVPRHLYREDARAYATDRKAQTLAQMFIEKEDWLEFHSIERYYAVLPFLHAEDVPRQERVNPIVNGLAKELPGLAFMGRVADLYLDTIRRFGYFPHRNALRGVPSTPKEERFLAEEWEPRRKRILPESITQPEPLAN